MGARERLCALDELTPGGARRIDVGDRRLAVVRIDDDVYVVGDRCTHQDISLAEGDVLVEEREIECWKHGSAFSLETGAPSSLPATKPTPVYEAEVVDGDVWVVLP